MKRAALILAFLLPFGCVLIAVYSLASMARRAR